MFFLTDGTLFYRRAKGVQAVRRNIKVKRGQWFCEATLWMPWIHRGTMRAIFDSDLIALHSYTFRKVTVAHEAAFLLCQRYATEFRVNMRRQQERFSHVWDLPEDLVYPKAVSDVDCESDNRYDARTGRKVAQAENLEAALMDTSESDDGDSNIPVVVKGTAQQA